MVLFVFKKISKLLPLDMDGGMKMIGRKCRIRMQNLEINKNAQLMRNKTNKPG